MPGGPKPGILQFLPSGAVRQRKEKPNAQDLIVPLMGQLVKEKERVIVFRNQRGMTQGCAEYLADELALPPARNALAQLPNHDLSSTSTALRECLSGGTAFHNTNLTREEKAVVEQGYRDPKGEIAVLAATTPVADEIRPVNKNVQLLMD